MKTFNEPQSLKENVDYELVPSEGENWDVRLLTGEFTETVIQYKELRVDETEEHLKFNFEIVSSPDLGLTDEEYALQKRVGDVLFSILETASLNAAEDKNKEKEGKDNV